MPVGPPGAPGRRRPGRRARTSRSPSRSRPCSWRAASTPGCTRSPSIGARSRGSLARALGGPLDPEAAGDIAAATPAERIPDGEARFAAVEETPGGFRTLAQVALPGADPTDVRRGAGRRARATAVTPTVTEPVWDAIRTRRAIRRFADRPLEPAHLERILHAGRRAGSSKNHQRWAFIVCRDREHLRELSRRRAVRRPPRRRRRRRSPSSRRTRSGRTRRCRSCSTSARPPRT